MEIYLVQHAESKSKEEDPERPLTDEGFGNIDKIASYARKHIAISLRTIIHSGKLRARRTAEALAGYLEPTEGISESDGLEPMADPSIWAERISKSEKDIMLVGHLPHLAKLAGVLLSGDETKNVIGFQNAGIVKLIRDADDNWRIDWIIVPSIV
ncbi:MAG: phosphohistidine phosphatase SixA [Candidatus Zixiibacteriota bacterium]|nr:MAG: phosphohistidine phosphatase SixA [candidate division Zixibacteria bacterium]